MSNTAEGMQDRDLRSGIDSRGSSILLPQGDLAVLGGALGESCFGKCRTVGLSASFFGFFALVFDFLLRFGDDESASHQGL